MRSRFHQDQSAADRAVTLRRLLSHQAGLPSDYQRDRYTTQTLGELPGKVSGVWLTHCPGTQTTYSNLGYALLGAAIERSSGQGYSFKRSYTHHYLRL